MKLQEATLARGRYRIVMMTCGYAESSTTGWLIFTTFTREDRFDTAAQAVIELALDLYAKYEEEVMSTQYIFHKECCKKAKQNDTEAKHCSKCGTRLKELEFDPEGFMDFVKGLHNTDCDGYGESEGTANRSFAYWPWRAEEIVGAGKDEIVLIGENAERVMLDALCEVRDDLRAITLENFSLDDKDEWRSTDWMRVRQKGTNHSY